MSDNLDTLMALMGQKLKNNVKNEKTLAKQELIIIQNKSFKYEKLDKEIADFLKMKQYEIFNIFNNTYTEIGRILKEAQEKLRGNNQYDGLFYKWFTSMGFKKDKVYSLISRYELLVENSDKQLIINNLPLSLSYEISKKSCPTHLKMEVLNGKIKSLKEFKSRYQKDEHNKKNLEINFNKTQLNREDIIKLIELLLQELENIKNIKLDKIENKKEFLIILKDIRQKINLIKKIT
ncbi:hypothetical protein [Borrelia turicatae]|uniref:Uncharacterized protein n=2 Tax=Borrelia turicatae TaxID=142 RepID=A0A172XBF4_BORTU|nr:hypothetical protein [Borrelia turicatae]AAX17760.1 hypothetical protein BT0432 [Borrelia turicatae 91E135]ANF33902.1 hypothetical protein A7978_02130 [Borrelia turicatae]UPA13273.1 hypothetical protein bt91E135_000425 [Borrelia turicatae 91E135]UPA14759.1 hypothetical protein btBTE5EL_000426 [Borrelia turicatae]